MSSKDNIKRLTFEGWYPAGEEGNHEKFKHITQSAHWGVPNSRKVMAIGTFRIIDPQAGMNLIE